MGRFQRSGWGTRKYFPGTMSWSKSDRVIGTAIAEAVVCLIDPPPRLAATPIEQKLVSALTKATPLPLASLVTTVADELCGRVARGRRDFGYRAIRQPPV